MQRRMWPIMAMMSCSTTQNVLLYRVASTLESNVSTPESKIAMTLQQRFRFKNSNWRYDRWLRMIEGLDWLHDYLKIPDSLLSIHLCVLLPLVA